MVRIATHPELNRMGYASRAMELLGEYYEGKVTNLSESEPVQPSITVDDDSIHTLQTEKLHPRRHLPPLLTALSDRAAEPLHWLGVSYGITQDLYNFWAKSKMAPVYLRLTPNDTTGEHTCIMVKAQEGSALQTVSNADWTGSFSQDFRHRFVNLLAFQFKSFPVSLALGFLMPYGKEPQAPPEGRVGLKEVQQQFSEFDVRRLESYSRNLVDYHLVLDLVPPLARLYFLGKLDLSLSYTQAAILLGVGLQHKSVTELEQELEIQSGQILALFNKAVKKMTMFMRGLEETEVKAAIEQDLSGKKQQMALTATKLNQLKTPLSHELAEGQDKVIKQMKDKQKKLLDSLNLNEFSIGGTDEDWNSVLGDQDATRAGAVSLKKDPASAVASKKRNRSKVPKSSGGGGGKKTKPK